MDELLRYRLPSMGESRDSDKVSYFLIVCMSHLMALHLMSVGSITISNFVINNLSAPTEGSSMRNIIIKKTSPGREKKLGSHKNSNAFGISNSILNSSFNFKKMSREIFLPVLMTEMNEYNRNLKKPLTLKYRPAILYSVYVL